MPKKIKGALTKDSIGIGSEKITNPNRDAIMGSPRGTDAIAVGDKYLIE